MRSCAEDDEGQAAVELVAVLPVLVALVLGAAQLALLGHAEWAAGQAAEAAARAQAVGGDPELAARRALPESLEPRLRVRAADEAVEVALRVPGILPALPAGRAEARAAFPGQR